MESATPRGSLASGLTELAREWSLGILLVVAAALRVFRLEKPAGALIFDEAYYVQDARVILGRPVLFDHLPGTALSGLDPNAEHPPLAKLIMAGFIHVIGDRGFAWRLPSVALGTLSIWLIHAIVLRLGGTRGQALLAAFILAFDNLFFVHGRIATLDIYVTTLALLGAWLYLSSRVELAGLAFGLAALCKLNGLFSLGALVLYEVLLALRIERGLRWSSLRPIMVTIGFALAFFLAALGALDCYWTSFRNPVAHIGAMLRYASHLTRTGSVQGAESTPLQWWLNENPISYLEVKTTAGDVTHIEVLFRGAMNEYVIFAAPFALIYAVRVAWRGTWSDSRLGTFAVAWFLANYGPFLLAWLTAGRVSYIYYMVPSLPAIAIAIAALSARLPRFLRWSFVGAVLYSFCLSFPFRKW